MNKLNVLLAKQLDNGNFYCKPSIIFALRIMLKGDQTANPTEYMNDYFYGEVGGAVASSGQFKYLPFDKGQQNDQFFVDVDSGKHKELTKNIYKARVNLIDGNTEILIMINCEILESLEDELSAMNTDLNEFVKLGYALHWHQEDLNNILLTPEEDIIAESEGWRVFELDSNGEELQLQYSTDAGIFNDNEDAWGFVIDKATHGSELHRKASALCARNPLKIH